jgi:hypothetical protein
MAKVWKIAPGGDASEWENCRDNGCIVMGWDQLGNYRQFGRNKEKIVRHLKGGPGNGKGAATSIVRFAYDIEESHLIVANKGITRVMGIGVVTSDYLPPGSLKYPSEDSWCPHARKVRWVVTGEVYVGKSFFGRSTVTSLKPGQVNRIRAAYERKDSAFKKLLDELFGSVQIDEQGSIDAQKILNAEERELKAEGAFNPRNLRDATERVQRSIVQRRGQSEFRQKLLRAYECRCAVTGCAVEELLEAAHIRPYLGPKSNHSTNGLLLRADLHTLFDLHLIAIDRNYCVVVSPLLKGSEYARLDGKKIRLPDSPASHPNREVLKEHRMQLRGAE